MPYTRFPAVKHRFSHVTSKQKVQKSISTLAIKPNSPSNLLQLPGVGEPSCATYSQMNSDVLIESSACPSIIAKNNRQRLCTVACSGLIPAPGCQSRKRWVFQTPVATACIHIYIYSISHVCASYMHTLKHCIFVCLEGFTAGHLVNSSREAKVLDIVTKRNARANLPMRNKPSCGKLG